MKKILSACMLLLAASVQAQQKYELTVKEAVDLAYKNVVELKNAQLDYRIQEAKNKEITGQAMPQITANASANHYLQVPKFLFPQSDEGVYSVLRREGLISPSTKAPDPTYAQVSFQQPWNLSLSGTLTQLLFQPDVFVGLQARQTALDYSQSLVDLTKEKIKDSAYKRYYAILVTQKQLYFINESIQRLEKLYHDDSIMYKNGFAERLDLDKVQVQINSLRSIKSNVDNAMIISYAAMKFALGVSQKDTVVLKEDLSIASIKEGILDESFAYENRAEIKTLNSLKKLQELDLKRYRMAYLPTVALQGNYTVNGMGPDFFTSGNTFWLNSSYVGLNVNVPIFSGLQRKRKIEQSQLTLEKVQNNIDLAKQGIDFEQAATKETLLNSIVNLDLQDKNLELAQRVYNATKLKFEQGLGNSFEVLQADTDYQNAQSNYFTALYSATVAKITYLYSLGKLQ